MKKSVMRVLAIVVVCVLFVAYGKYVKAQTSNSAEWGRAYLYQISNMGTHGVP